MPDSAEEAGGRLCPLCGGGARRALPAYSRAPWQVAECPACGFVYLANPPGHAALAEEFAWEETSVSERQRRKHAAPWLYGLDEATRKLRTAFRKDEMRAYLRWFGEGAKVLDIGCGAGGRVRPPLVPFGIEISTRLAQEADARMREHGGACVQAPGAEGIWAFPEGHFDGILMRSYLEHEEAPRRVLEGAHRALKPAGKIYVKVPNYGSVNRRVIGANWCGFRHPDHVNYFTRATLTRLAEVAGFGARLLNTLNLAFDDNIHTLLTRR